MNRQSLHPVIAAVALAMPAIAWCQDTPLTPQEIQAAWAGKELTGAAANGMGFVMRFEADGKASLSIGNLNDSGTWRLNDTGYCAKWTTIRSGQERCFTVVKSGGQFKVLNSDGSVNSNVTSVR